MSREGKTPSQEGGQRRLLRKLLTILNAMLGDQGMWNAARHLQPSIGP